MAATAGPSTAPTAPSITPSTLLPTDPTSLTKYIHHAQLESLRDLFASKSASVAHSSSQDSKARRARRSRQRRRRYSPGSNLDADDDSEDENEFLAKEGEALEKGIDKGHAWELVYDLSPNSGADTYYHGPHPLPPAKVVKAVMRASKLSPFFDPNGLSSQQLYEPAKKLWESELGDNSTTTEEWEMDTIAFFSTECTKRKARAMQNGSNAGGNGDSAKRTRSTSGERAPPPPGGPGLAVRGQSPFAQLEDGRAAAYAQAQAQAQQPVAPVAAAMQGGPGQVPPYWKGVYPDRW